MLPGNIDLTANRDFGAQGGVNFIDADTILGIDVDGEMMSIDQYDKIVKWESVFGKKRHMNQKSTIFNKEWSFIEKSKYECQRCGKKIIVPWKNFYGLCKECDEIVSHNSKKIPWKISKPIIRRVGDRGQANLFDLR